MLITVLLLLIAVAVGLYWAGKRVYDQAMDARQHLTAALPYATELKKSLVASDTEAASAAAEAFREEALAAQHSTNGRLWTFAETVPLPLLENLRAVSTVTDVAVALADEVLVPASGISIRTLAPVNGKIDVAALRELASTVDGVVAGTAQASAQLATIDQEPLIDMVRSGVGQFDEALAELRMLAETAQPVLKVLPGALGGDGPRNYLLMFEGNAELRASGGGPGSFMLLTAEDGTVVFGREAAATDFTYPTAAPVVPLDEETRALYSNILGTWIANLTGTPDFPTSARLAQGWWGTMFDDHIDGVISVDPIALSYLLRATGPISLPTGDVLTPENTVPLLLNEAYLKYPVGRDSNAFFSAVAGAVLNGILSSSPDAFELVDALTQAVDEGRLKMWSAHEEEAALLGETRLAGVLPTSNDDTTTVGVFFNDTTGAKMDYYVDAAVALHADQCVTSDASWVTSVELKNSISRSAANRLPRYITGPHYRPGDIATDVVIYSPVGGTITDWDVEGASARRVSHTTHLGRDAIRIAVRNGPESTATVTVRMTGPQGAYGPAEIRHTPMVRETPVDISTSPCE